jgi:hypothetical protein
MSGGKAPPLTAMHRHALIGRKGMKGWQSDTAYRVPVPLARSPIRARSGALLTRDLQNKNSRRCGPLSRYPIPESSHAGGAGRGRADSVRPCSARVKFTRLPQAEPHDRHFGVHRNSGGSGSPLPRIHSRIVKYDCPSFCKPPAELREAYLGLVPDTDLSSLVFAQSRETRLIEELAAPEHQIDALRPDGIAYNRIFPNEPYRTAMPNP